MKFKDEIRKLSLNKDDVLIVTMGSLEHNIFPSVEDMEKAKEFYNAVLGNKVSFIIVSPLHKLTVLRKNKNKKLKENHNARKSSKSS